MVKCFFRTCLLVLSVLIGSTGYSHAQTPFRIIPQVVRIDTLYLGTSVVDTFLVTDFGPPRHLFPIRLDQPRNTTLTILDEQQYPMFVADPDTVRQGYVITSTTPGLDTFRLALSDSDFVGDTLTFIVNVLPQAASFTVDGDKNYGPLIIGAPILDSFIIYTRQQPVRLGLDFLSNRADESITIFGFPFGKTTPENDSIKIVYQLKNDSIGLQDLRIAFTDSISGDADTLIVTVTGIPPTPVDSVFALRPNARDVFAKIVTSDTVNFAIIIRNVTDSVYQINQIIIENAPHFSVQSILPIAIQPNEAFDLILRHTSTEEGFYPTVVRLPNDGGLASEYSLNVQVLRVALMTAPPQITRSGIRVVQSAQSIAIEGLPYEQGSIEICDIMGRTQLRAEHTQSQILLPKQNAFGEPLSDGAYFIRLISRDGRHAETLKVLLVGY